MAFIYTSHLDGDQFHNLKSVTSETHPQHIIEMCILWLKELNVSFYLV